MPAAARLNDPHQCPMKTGPVPHVGGPITGPGSPSVMIAGQPASVLGDACSCHGPAAAVSKGSANVFICGKPAARKDDDTSHGGKIVQGAPTVMIGG